VTLVDAQWHVAHVRGTVEWQGVVHEAVVRASIAMQVQERGKS
jgi:hypothetical protein